MVRVVDIYDILNAVAPFSTALNFDNVGILVGDGNAEISRALLALDITPEVVEEAASKNAGLIISHHPVIFEPLRQLSARDVPYLLAKNGIAALCCHTNLDLSSVCGVNMALAGKLGLRSIRREDVFGEDAVLFSGELETALSPSELAGHVKQRLSAQWVSYIAGKSAVKKVFLCSGSGGNLCELAACRGADAFITGEMKHHEALLAKRLGLTCVVAGHYETEIVFAEFLAAYLKKRFPETAFLLSQSEKSPFFAC